MKKPECFESGVTAADKARAIHTDSPLFRPLTGEFYAVLVSTGDRVKHDLWGSGTVISARGVGALVEFDYLGQTVFVSASALETLSGLSEKERRIA